MLIIRGQSWLRKLTHSQYSVSLFDDAASVPHASAGVTVDLKDLRLFLHLTKTLHFARSSRDMHISPSGLTRAIQRLEEELDVVLFERDNRTVRLTHAGEMLRDFAGDVLDRWSVLQGDLQARSLMLNGQLSLFCSVTASYSFLHELLQSFRSVYPQVELQLNTGDSALALQRVLDEHEDIAIAARPEKLPDNVAFLSLGQSPLICIGPTAPSPVATYLQQVRSAGNYEWASLPLIMQETGLARARVERWFAERGIRPDIYAQVSGHEAMVSMVSLGVGVAVVPRVVVDNSPVRDRIQILPLMHELEPFEIGLCALRRRFANPLVKAFWSVAETGATAAERMSAE